MNWTYFNPRFEYEEKFQDAGWPWTGHKFFAYDLVANLKPRVIVELGTHYGTSLWSFAQAAKDLDIEAQLSAIDTWEGERHAGFYSEEVFETVNQVRDKYYHDLKINLIRKTFDDALLEFEDNSIDILHIDGLHTYEAVKHDYETWLPKIRDNGIVLFHDIIVTKDDFGVYRLWDELRCSSNCIEFFHSYGLGVLFKNDDFGISGEVRKLQLHYEFKNKEIESCIINKYIIETKNKDIEIEKVSSELRQSKVDKLLMQSSNFWKARCVYIEYKSKIFFLIFSPRKFVKKYFGK